MGIKRTVLIRKIDLSYVKKFHRKKILNKKQIAEIMLFPLYFWAKPFVKCLANSGRLNMLLSNNFWFHLVPLDQMKDFLGVPQWFSKSHVFYCTLLSRTPMVFALLFWGKWSKFLGIWKDGFLENKPFKGCMGLW